MTTDRFTMNGYLWRVVFVEPNDPELVDRTGEIKLATTNPRKRTVCLNNTLCGDFLMTVFIHELGHCALWSFGFLDYIHRLVPRENWIDMEEFICNFLADYGLRIFRIAYQKMGYEAWKVIPQAFEQYVA